MSSVINFLERESSVWLEATDSIIIDRTDEFMCERRETMKERVFREKMSRELHFVHTEPWRFDFIMKR
jgi:hypothetical protein